MEQIIAVIFSVYEFLCMLIVSILLISIYANNASITYTSKVDIPKGTTKTVVVKDILSDLEYTIGE
jgi:hypothetical protein